MPTWFWFAVVVVVYVPCALVFYGTLLGPLVFLALALLKPVFRALDLIDGAVHGCWTEEAREKRLDSLNAALRHRNADRASKRK